MKNYLLLTVVLLLSATFAFANEEAFYKALEGCSLYSSSGETRTEGAVAKYQSQILGWQSDKCVYKEIVSFAGIDSCTTCRFTQRQIDELVNVMRAYSTVQRYSGGNVDTSTLQAVTNNPVVNVWNKYLRDSSVCIIELSK